jgi:hypothetical protein
MPDTQPPGLYSRQQYARQLYGGQRDEASSTGSADKDLETDSDTDGVGSWHQYVSPDLLTTIHELEGLWVDREHGSSPHAQAGKGQQQQQQQQPLLSLEQLLQFRPSQGGMPDGLEAEAAMEWVELLRTAANADADVATAVCM